MLIFVPPRGGGGRVTERGTQPTRPNFSRLSRILYEASTIDAECAPSIWSPGNSPGLGVTIMLFLASGVAQSLVAPLDLA